MLFRSLFLFLSVSLLRLALLGAHRGLALIDHFAALVERAGGIVLILWRHFVAAADGLAGCLFFRRACCHCRRRRCCGCRCSRCRRDTFQFEEAFFHVVIFLIAFDDFLALLQNLRLDF